MSKQLYNKTWIKIVAIIVISLILEIPLNYFFNIFYSMIYSILINDQSYWYTLKIIIVLYTFSFRIFLYWIALLLVDEFIGFAKAESQKISIWVVGVNLCMWTPIVMFGYEKYSESVILSFALSYFLIFNYIAKKQT